MRLKAFSLLILLGVVWGSGYAIARFCVTHGVPPLGYSFWQSLGPAILLSLLALRHTPTLSPVQIKPLLLFALIAGLFGIALPNSIMYFASVHLPSAMVAILVNTVPLFIYPLALFLKIERHRSVRLILVLLGVIGIMILNWQAPHLTDARTPWSLLVLISPLCFALCAVLIQPLKPATLSSLNAAALMLTASFILLLPTVIMTKSFYLPRFHAAADFWLLAEMILSSLGYVLFFRLIQSAGPIYYSLVGGVVAITGVMLGFSIFKETLASKDLFALLLVLAAILGMTFNKTIYGQQS